jgi:hypothetical protein
MNPPIDETSPPLVAQPDRRVYVSSAPRRHWPGLLLVALVAAGLAALVVSRVYDNRSLGEKIDATVNAATLKMNDGVDNLRVGASTAVHDSAQAGGQVAEAISDAGITASVKTALAADPQLSALKIDVKTESGVVSLVGPAPDDRSRERAAVLAAAPAGVLRVDNRLVVTPPPGALR